MTGYKNNFITAARSGGSAYILLCAVISVAQDPGSDDMRFSVSTYMIIFGCLLSLPIFAYKYIIDNNCGLRESNSSSEKTFTTVEIMESSSPSSSGKSIEISSLKVKTDYSEDVNPLHEDTKENFTEAVSPSQKALIGTNNKRKGILFLGVYMYSGMINDWVNRMMASFAAIVVSDKRHSEMPWLRKTVPYMLTVGWVNFNTWGMVTALLPFAMSNASTGSGSSNLAIAYELAAVLLVMGNSILIRNNRFFLFICN